MAKQSIAEKIAERSFRSDKIQNDWEVHMRAFGPILKPALMSRMTKCPNWWMQ